MHQVGRLGGGEGPECRICLVGDHPEALIAACNCIGSMRFAHVSCLEVCPLLDPFAASSNGTGHKRCREPWIDSPGRQPPRSTRDCLHRDRQHVLCMGQLPVAVFPFGLLRSLEALEGSERVSSPGAACARRQPPQVGCGRLQCASAAVSSMRCTHTSCLKGCSFFAAAAGDASIRPGPA